MITPARINIEAFKDEDGNLAVMTGVESITEAQRDALLLAMSELRGLPFDGSIGAVYLEGDTVVIEGRTGKTVIEAKAVKQNWGGL